MCLLHLFLYQHTHNTPTTHLYLPTNNTRTTHLLYLQGRLIDHVRNSASVGLEDLQVLVLDEADRLLEMGFADEISEIVKMAPVKRQTLLFSATMTDQVCVCWWLRGGGGGGVLCCIVCA